VSEIFSSSRFGILLRNDAISGYRSLLTVSATLAGLLLVGVLLSRGGISSHEYFYLAEFVTMLLIWGPIASSRSFKELHNKTENEAYLLLPASALEKVCARLLFATLFFYVYLLLFTSLTSVVVESLSAMLFGQQNQRFNPLDAMEWHVFGHFLVIQSLYFLGAAWFRKNHFIKTTLAITIACIGLALLALAVFRFVLILSFDDFEVSLDNFYSLSQVVVDAAAIGLTILYFVGLPVICWLVAWLRVRETQVSDGV
jgi:hypothetical protein